MEVRPGYKQTEVGVIPVDWEVVEFGDIAAIRSEKVVASLTPLGTKCVELECISQGSGRLLMSSEASGLASKYSFYKGDVLFGRLRAYLRKYWLANFDGICSTEIWPLVARDDRLFGSFLHLLVQTDDFVNAAGVSYGTHMPRSDWSVLRKVTVKLPPVPEQRVIAAALSDVDALLAGLDRLIAKKRDLKQAAMQQLLTGQTRLPSFRGEWEVKRLGDICRITTGRKDVNEGNPNGQYPFFTCSRSHTFSDSYSFDTEAILIAGNGEVGNLNYFSGKFEAYQRTYVLYDFSVQVNYLWQQLIANLAESLGLGKIGSSIPYIKKANLTEFEFGIPKDTDEQCAIAAVLSDMDAELAALEARCEKTRDLKQAMMQELLTGRIRLVSKELKAESGE